MAAGESMRFNFFARNEGTFIALALIGGVAIMPFAINNFVQGRLLLGSFNALLAAWFLVHGVAVLRGRRLLPPPVVFVPAIAMLAYAMWARGDVGIFWAYPAVLLFHFILGRRAANYFNFSVMVFTTVFAYQSYGPDVALRAGVTLFLTIIFANVFSYVSETQRGREVEQEQLLELERDRLALLVHATQAGFTDWDTKANVVIYSERFKEMLGYPSDFDTATWRSFFELMHPEDHPRVREVFRGLMREKRKPGLQPPGAPLEYRLLRNGGGHVWVKAASLAQVDAAGRIRRFITSFQDISSYREQEASLRTEQRRLDLVVRAARAGIVDWDGRTHATWYSPRFREILGHPPDADTTEWPDYFSALIHPEDRDRVIARFREYIRGAGPEGPAEYYDPEEYRLLRADGSYVWVQSQGVCVRDERKFVTRFIAAIIDISERRAAADALRDQVKFSADVFDALPMGLAMRDLDGRYVFVNRTWEEYVGAKRADVIGKTVRQRTTPEEADAVEAEDQAALARGPDAPVELKDLHHGGKRFMLTRTVLTDANGAPRGVLVASLDTTERMRMEEALAGEQRRARAGDARRQRRHPRLGRRQPHRRTTRRASRRCCATRPTPTPRAGPTSSTWCIPRTASGCSTRFREHILGTGPGGPSDMHETLAVPPAPRRRQLRLGRGLRRLGARRQRLRDALHRLAHRHQRAALPGGGAARGGAPARGGRAHVAPRPEDAAQQRDRDVAPAARERQARAARTTSCSASIERAGYRMLNMVNLSLDLFRMEQGSYEFRPQPVDLAEVARRVAADLESQAASKGVAVRGAHAGRAHRARRGAAVLLDARQPDQERDRGRARRRRGDGDGRGRAATRSPSTCTTTAWCRRRCARASSRSTPPPARAAASAWAPTRRACMARVQQGDITLRTSAGRGHHA